MGEVVPEMKLDRRALGVAAAVAIVLGLPATALALTLHRSAHATRSPAPPSRTTSGTARIGALYRSGSPQLHNCTASVVDSPRGDTLMTAAHCVSGNASGMTFAPAQHGETQPDGRWVVTAVHVTPRWVTRQDPHDDVAFLTVAPRDIDGRLTEIQQVTGGYRLGPAARAGEHVTITGYPVGTNDDAVTCDATVYMTMGYPSFDCQGYADGTSGSPWVHSTADGPEIVGVIGGLHQGGCVNSTSYSPIISVAVTAAYRLAGQSSGTDLAPVAGGNGC